jgi:hypothetical protein
MSQATESLFAENHEHFFNSIDPDRPSALGGVVRGRRGPPPPTAKGDERNREGRKALLKPPGDARVPFAGAKIVPEDQRHLPPPGIMPSDQ